MAIAMFMAQAQTGLADNCCISTSTMLHPWGWSVNAFVDAGFTE